MKTKHHEIIFALSTLACSIAIGCSSETNAARTEYPDEPSEVVDAGTDGPVSISDDRDAGKP